MLRAADKISDLQQISQEFTQVAICVRAAMGSLASDKAELLHRHTEDVITSFVTALEVGAVCFKLFQHYKYNKFIEVLMMSIDESTLPPMLKI